MIFGRHPPETALYVGDTLLETTVFSLPQIGAVHFSQRQGKTISNFGD
jgi:hypothetical protein